MNSELKNKIKSHIESLVQKEFSYSVRLVNVNLSDVKILADGTIFIGENGITFEVKTKTMEWTENGFKALPFSTTGTFNGQSISIN